MKKLVILVIIATICLAEPTLISQSFMGNAFTDADGWSTSNAPAHITECSGTKMFGGYNKFGAQAMAVKTFNLPPHHSLTLKVQMWKIDSWDNEEFIIWIDDKIPWRRHFQVTEGGSQKCGGGHNWYEMILNIKVDMKHTGPSAIVVFESSLNQAANDESWAIREFQLFVEKCPENCSACSEGQSQEVCSQWVSVASSWTAMERLKMGAEGWTLTGGKAEATQCGGGNGGIILFGGYDKTGGGAALSRQFKLPPHYRLKIKLLFAKIESWDNEQAQLKIDGTLVWSQAFQVHNGFISKVCGPQAHAAWKDWMYRVEVEAAHTGTTANFIITTTLNQAANDESFGVRDFYLFAAKCAPNCDQCTGPKPADCKKCSNNWVVQDGQCKPLANFILLEQSFLQSQFVGTNGWILKNNKGGASISQCGQTSMIGGYNIFGLKASAEKTFEIPPHHRLRLQMTIFKIDSWDNEWMYVKVDGVDVYKQQWNLQTGGVNLCGLGQYPDGKFEIDEIFNHEGSHAHIFLTSTLNQDANDESWGFRDFKLWYEAKEACPILYSECDYKGASFEFCAKSPNFQNDGIPPRIRSIRVPPQGRVTFYESTDYNGKKVVYTEDQPCIKSFDFSLLQMSGETEGEWKQIPEVIANQ